MKVGQGGTWASPASIQQQPHVNLASTATITISGNAGYDGVIFRAGATFPVANASAYAGTALKLAAGGANDTRVSALIVGFAVCFDGTTGGDRYRLDIECDGNPSAGSGAVIIGPSYDTSYAKIRTWPWGTTFSASPVNTRTGYGIQILSGAQDDSHFDLLDFGHDYGIVTAANGNVHYTHIFADNNTAYVS